VSPRNAARVYRPIGARGEPYPQWVRDLDGESGVYIIRDRNTREIVYVGSSVGRLYDTLVCSPHGLTECCDGGESHAA
jgi:hypothetical protein